MDIDFSGKKILIIRLSSLGDVLLTTPVIREISQDFPSARIFFLVQDIYYDAVRFNSRLENVFKYSKKNDNSILLDSLKTMDFDFIFDFQNNRYSRKIAKSLNIPTFSFKKPTFAKFLLVHTKINLLQPIISIPNRYLQSVFPNKILSNPTPEFYNEAETLVKSKSIIKNEIAICPGSQHFTKMYPIEYQIELCKMLVQNGFSVKLLGGKADKFVCNLIKSEVPQVIDKSNDNNLFEIADEIATSEFVICNDSGLLHLATAISNKIIAIFGSTVKDFGFAPNSENVTIFEDNSIKCRPCSHVGKSKCPKKHFNCMLQIQPKQIFNSICEFSRC